MITKTLQNSKSAFAGLALLALGSTFYVANMGYHSVKEAELMTMAMREYRMAGEESRKAIELRKSIENVRNTAPDAARRYKGEIVPQVWPDVTGWYGAEVSRMETEMTLAWKTHTIYWNYGQSLKEQEEDHKRKKFTIF